jgi:hypothetical protein
MSVLFQAACFDWIGIESHEFRIPSIEVLDDDKLSESDKQRLSAIFSETKGVCHRSLWHSGEEV